MEMHEFWDIIGFQDRVNCVELIDADSIFESIFICYDIYLKLFEL